MSLSSHSQKKIRKMKAKWRIDSPEDYEEMEKFITKKELENRERETVKGTIRIIAGSVKNTKLDIPKNTRPLTDRLKTSIFDILSSDINKKNILDLYAGAGSFGLEALSRGAKNATFVDASKSSERILNSNIEKTGFTNSTEVIKEKVEDFLGHQEELEKTYDIIFLDPPYKKFNMKNLNEIENVLNSSKTMLPGFKKGSKKKFMGALILKHPRKYPVDNLSLSNLEKIETYNFGLNSITIFIVKEQI